MGLFNLEYSMITRFKDFQCERKILSCIFGYLRMAKHKGREVVRFTIKILRRSCYSNESYVITYADVVDINRQYKITKHFMILFPYFYQLRTIYFEFASSYSNIKNLTTT